MKRLKKYSYVIILIAMFTFLFQSKLILAEEEGILLNGMYRQDVVESSGVWGQSKYSADKKSITFRFNFNFKFNLFSNTTNTVIEVEPDLIPYVHHIEVIDNMGHSTTPRSKFVVYPSNSNPGAFIFSTTRALQVHACGFTHTGEATIVLNRPVDKLPKDKYVYSLKLVDPRQNNNYILKSRIQGVIEKNPDNYDILDIDYGVFKSYLGFHGGRPLASENTLQLKYCVSFAAYPLRSSNFVFDFYPELADYIDRVEIFHSTTNELVKTSVPESGIVSIPLPDVYPNKSLFMAMPINAKVYLKSGYTLGSLPNESYKITTFTTSSSVTGQARILKDSVCTLGFNTK